MRAAIPQNETERQAALDRYGILDTPTETDFDDLAKLASHVCDTPIALVSLVDRERQWFKASCGIDVQEMHRDIAFCAHAIHREEVLVVNDTHQDERFADNPLVQSEPHIRFYAGAPLLTPDGFKLGTVCAVDLEPKTLSDNQLNLLQGIARQVVGQLELRRNLRGLEKANRSKDQLFSLISHDLRNPLQGIMGLSELFQQNIHQMEREDIRFYAHQILGSSIQLQSILDNLLELARFELGDLPFQPGPVVVGEVVEQIFQLFAKRGSEKALRLLHLPQGSPVAFTDRELLLPVLRNLVSNAIKYSHPRERVEVLTRTVDQRVEIEVRDHGVGMAPEILEGLFRGHSQRSTVGTAGERGTGMGLMLVQQFVDRLGGRLQAVSTLGEGTSFVLSLPVPH